MSADPHPVPRCGVASDRARRIFEGEGRQDFEVRYPSAPRLRSRRNVRGDLLVGRHALGMGVDRALDSVVICALPLASRRARAPLAGVACAAMTVWLLLFAYFGGLVFLPEAFVLFIAALPAHARWTGTVLVGGLATAGFLPQPDPWRVFGWASGIVVVGALLYRAGNILRVTALRHRA